MLPEPKNNEQNTKPKSSILKKESPQSEHEFLVGKAEQAKLAMKETAEELQKNLGKVLNVEAWIKKHPWPSLGIGDLAGFAAGYLVIPDKNGKREEHAPEISALEKAASHEEQYKTHPLRTALASGLSGLALDISREFVHQWMNKSKDSVTEECDSDVADVPSPS